MEFSYDDDEGEKEFFYGDCRTLLKHEKLQEKDLRHKRRWLIGLPTPLNKSGKLKEYKLRIERPIPESLLRVDDVFYEVIKSYLEERARESNTKDKYHVAQGDMQLIYSPRGIAGLLSLVNDMTNQGLQQFAEVLTNSSIKFEKTRWKMKQIIKERLLEAYSKQKNNRQIILSETHSSLLKNPLNFRWSSESRFISDSNSYHAAVYKILNVLESLPTQTVWAMHRKIRGIKGYKPWLIPKKTGWGREKLIKSLRKKCLKLLSKLDPGDSLQKPLAKAMEVASLNLKLIQGYHYAPNFLQSSAELNSLQNEIATYVKLLDQRVRISALKDIILLFDPDAKLAGKNLRALLRTLLTEYLYECGDMDTVPQCLLEAIAVIRRSCETRYNCLTEAKVEEEIECILSLSASTKQVLWDLIPEHEFDFEFADAYMEDLEDADADDFELEHTETDVSCSSYLDEKVGSSWENCTSVESPECLAEICPTEEATYSGRVQSTRYYLVNLRNTEQKDNDFLKDADDDEHTHIPEKNPDVVSCIVPCLENSMIDGQGVGKNKYVSIQAASDEASMVAYCLIDHMLNDFAQIEGCELNSGDMSYLGAGSRLKGKKRKAVRKEASADKEDGFSILMKAVEEIIPSSAERYTKGVRLKRFLPTNQSK